MVLKNDKYVPTLVISMTVENKGLSLDSLHVLPQFEDRGDIIFASLYKILQLFEGTKMVGNLSTSNI